MLVTLSKSGSITSPHKIANLLFYYAFYSERAQSRYFKEDVLSIQQIFYEGGDHLPTLIEALHNGLTANYRKYFDSVTVTVDSADDPKEVDPHFSVDISVKVRTEDGDIDLFFNLQQVENNNLKLIEFNNTGQPTREVTR